MQILTNLDLNKNQLLNTVLQQLSALPSSPSKGQIYFSTLSNTVQVWDGTKWLDIGATPEMAMSNIPGLQEALDQKTSITYVDLELTKKETPLGAQTKANTAESNAKAYTDGKVLTDVPVNAKFTDTIVTKVSLDLENVDNTSDLAKPVSTATQTALNLKETPLGAQTKANTAESNAKAYVDGKVLTDVPANAKFTDTIATKTSIGLGDIDNTSDLAKPVSAATQAALDLKESIANVNTKVNTAENAAKLYADTEIAKLIGEGTSTALDTLKELADALGNDPNFAATITASLAGKNKLSTKTIGNGTLSTFVLNHTYNSRDLQIEIRQSGAPYQTVYTDVERTTLNQITIKFAQPPAANAYTVMVSGIGEGQLI